MFRPLILTILASLIAFPLAGVKAQELTDPMQPPRFAIQKFQQAKNKNSTSQDLKKVAKKPQILTLTLTSILFSDTRKIAIIDGQMLAVGDMVNGARLVRIKKESVRLVHKGKTIDLNLANSLTLIRKTAVASKL